MCFYTILSSSDKRFGVKLPIGAVVKSNVQLNDAKTELRVVSSYKGIDQIRTFKRKGANEADDEDDNALINELEQSKDDDE